MTARKLKRVVIKEELYSLTKDTFSAIILGQLIYWQVKVNDFDTFIKEENERAKNNGIDSVIDLQNGWMYKKASDLADECMLNVSDATMRRYLQVLIEKKFISCRKNPKYKWDKTLQYRVNLSFIISEVKKLGYDGLGGYISPNIQNENTDFQNECPKEKNGAAIPESTNRDYSREEDKSSKKDIDEFVEMVYKMYPTKCPKRNTSLGKCSKDKDRIRRLLKTYTKEQIVAVVKYEVDTKYGKEWMSNFSTFLNNFPDPDSIDEITQSQNKAEQNQQDNDRLIINGIEYK